VTLLATADAPGVEERVNVPRLVALASREHNGERRSPAYGAQMPFGGEAAQPRALAADTPSVTVWR
jgi:hypothetical protein